MQIQFSPRCTFIFKLAQLLEPCVQYKRAYARFQLQHCIKMIRARISALLLVSSAICLALVSGDPITISGNTIGDLVNVNVNVTANIQNEINQDYVNILALLLSSTGDVELFRRLSHAAEETDAAPSTMAPSTEAKAPSLQSQPKQDIDIEEALRKLFPKLVNKQ